MASRDPKPEEQKIIDDVLKLYQLKPSEQAYSHYAETAVFHDPVSIAKGLDSIKSQFNGMPKIFETSTTQSCKVLEETTPSSLVLDLTQHYVFKGGNATPEKTLNSKITLKLNSSGLIKHHEEEWEHEKNPSSDRGDGFMGKLSELRKKFDAKLVETLVSKDPSKA